MLRMGRHFARRSSTWITIPSGGQNQFLAPDVRLCFSVTNTSEQMITLDGTICSAISKLEIYCGANLLVSVQEYGALFSMLYDTQAPSTHRSTAGKLLGVSDTARMGEPIENYLFGENINPAPPKRLASHFCAGCFTFQRKRYRSDNCRRISVLKLTGNRQQIGIVGELAALWSLVTSTSRAS